MSDSRYLLKRLRLTGYRSLQEVEWLPGGLNILIGENASGKTNLLKSLEILSASARGKLQQTITDEGGLDALLWDGQGKSIRIEAEFDTGSESSLTSLKYVLEIERQGRGNNCRITSESLTYYNENAEASALTLMERSERSAEVYNEREGNLTSLTDALEAGESLLFQLAGPITINQMLREFQKNISSWTVYRALDTGPEAQMRRETVARTEKKVDFWGDNLPAVLHTLYTGDRDFRETLDDSMRAAFGSDFDGLLFPPASDQRIQLRVSWKSLSQPTSAADLSDGTLRFLFLIAVLADPDPAPLIAIDEPETGLHPSMFGVLADLAAQAMHKSVVVFATHSAAVLDALQECAPCITVARRIEGITLLSAPAPANLNEWLKSYTLGTLYTAYDLEQMA